MMSDASRIAGHQVDLAAAAQIIENGANNIGIFMNQVGRMANAMQSLNPNAIADLQQQINQLVSQNLTRKY
jgi:mannose-1-phosphate guanylyltransferase